MWALTPSPLVSSSSSRDMVFPRTTTTATTMVVGGILAAALLPVSAHAVEVIKVEADFPALIQVAKDNKGILLKLAQESYSAIRIPTLPSNLVEFARDAAAGDVFVEINGYPVDLSLVSEKGLLDVGISTSQGDISLTISSKYLPRLPFLAKRNSVTTTTKTASDRTATPNANSDSTSAAAATNVRSKSPTIFDQLDPFFFLDPFQQGWTNLQVLGLSTLGVGASYAASYYYYVKSGEEEERAAQAKRNKSKTSAAAAAKQQPTPSVVALSLASVAAVEPPIGKESGTAAAPIPIKVKAPAIVVVAGTEVEPAVRSEMAKDDKPTTGSAASVATAKEESLDSPKGSKWRFWQRTRR